MNKKLPGRDLTVFSLLFTRYCSARNFRTFCVEILSFSARNRIFLRFLCIAKRVTGHGVNGNVNELPFTRRCFARCFHTFCPVLLPLLQKLRESSTIDEKLEQGIEYDRHAFSADSEK